MAQAAPEPPKQLTELESLQLKCNEVFYGPGPNNSVFPIHNTKYLKAYRNKIRKVKRSLLFDIQHESLF